MSTDVSLCLAIICLANPLFWGAPSATPTAHPRAGGDPYSMSEIVTDITGRARLGPRLRGDERVGQCTETGASSWARAAATAEARSVMTAKRSPSALWTA